MTDTFDYAVVPLSTVAIEPGSRCKLTVTTAKGKELVLLDISSPLFSANDDGSRGEPNTSIIWFVQFGADLQWSVKKRLSENQMRMTVNADGKMELRLEPKQGVEK